MAVLDPRRIQLELEELVEAQYPGLRLMEVLLGIFLVSVSGLGVLAQTYGDVPMRYTAPFIVFPLGCLLGIAILMRQKLPVKLHAFTTTLIQGTGFGLLATLCYDAIRPPFVALMGFEYDPYKAIYIFGQLITGEHGTGLANVTGWAYHFWNGISFAMIFAIVRPRGGILAGLLWGEVLQLILTVTYVNLINLNPTSHEALLTGGLGHGAWGVVLGACLKYQPRLVLTAGR